MSEFELVRRDSIRAGDTVWSSHYGEVVVEKAFTQGAGEHGGTTELVFPQISGTLYRNERYVAVGLIPLKLRAIS
jgi:hypothetical protein